MSQTLLVLLSSPLSLAFLVAPVPRTALIRRAAARLSVPRMDDTDTMPVPEAFLASRQTYIKDFDEYKTMYERSIRDPEGFWGEIAKQFHWEVPFTKVVDFNFKSTNGKIFSRWFEGGKTNICYNALDRHVKAGHGGQIAMYHESNEEGEELPSWTYAQMLAEVEKMGSWLLAQGVKPGDKVSIFMPMVPQLPIAMLACARIGAVHSVVFGGFSAEALANRLVDAQSTVVITADGVMRGTKPVKLFETVAAAAALCSSSMPIAKVLILQRLGPDKLKLELEKGRDVWWHEALSAADPSCAIEWMGAEDPLFVLYTSGSTGKPKGVVHTTGGYMVYAATTSKYIFDLKPEDTFFCTADCGWITGHSYVTYGPMLNRAKQLVFEGVPSYPDAGRLWRAVDKYEVTQIYTAPTAIRSLMKVGDTPVTSTSRKSLKLLGSVGEPINPEAWRWYHKVVGDGRCPIVDTWWQTETGGIMITPLPTKGFGEKPGCASLPFFGVQPVLLTSEGVELEGAAEGLLALKGPWPSAIRAVLGDYERFRNTYFPIDGYYMTGDGARRDEDGYIWITGRVDDVINTSGHRIGTAEVESAMVLHPKVAEAAVVGYPHPIKGEGIYVYVTVKQGVEQTEELLKELNLQCRKEIGAFATPDVVHWAPALPKTRSGKIMRRILRKIAAGQISQEDLGDTSTLAEPGVVDILIQSAPNNIAATK